MESTLMATSAIVLAAAMGLYVTFTARFKDIVDMAVLHGGIEGGDGWVKPSILLGCFVFSFLCNAQSIRFLSSLNFLLNVPMSLGPNNTCNDNNNNVGQFMTMGGGHEEEVSDLLYRATLLNTVGSRSLYFGASGSSDLSLSSPSHSPSSPVSTCLTSSTQRLSLGCNES